MYRAGVTSLNGNTGARVAAVQAGSDERGRDWAVVERLRNEHRRSGTAQGYREAAIATGWTAPESTSLFPTDDRLLLQYTGSPGLKKFEKHLPGETSPYEPLADGGWITGAQAITQRGIDLRLFFDTSQNTVVGLVRFDEAKASIGAGFGLSVHGGAIQTVLDEATAEAGKMVAFPYLATRKISHEIRKPVPSDRTLIVRTEVTQVKGLRCYVRGELVYGEDTEIGYDEADAGLVLAVAEAELVNMTPFIDSSST